MPSHYYIGVMSGTSLDGINLALLDFTSPQQPQLFSSNVTMMPVALRQDLSNIIQCGTVSLQQLGELDQRLGVLYAQTINQFLHDNDINAEQIIAIGCHGQTIWHSVAGNFPFTMQIGDPNIISALTNITTIADFRRKDVAFGGQGAPLVPAFHQAIFTKANTLTAVLNLGGISNISILMPNSTTVGYDTGPGNTLMDLWIEKNCGRYYDKNGEWAKTGKVDSNLLSSLLADPFFQLLPPKSTGREYFNLTWLTQKINLQKSAGGKLREIDAKDIQATLLALTVQSIAQQLRLITLPAGYSKRLLVCGGGAKNRFLLDELAYLLDDWNIQLTTEIGIDADFVEAAAFAWLAYCRINNISSNLPQVTGARQSLSLGVIYPNNDDR